LKDLTDTRIVSWMTAFFLLLLWAPEKPAYAEAGAFPRRDAIVIAVEKASPAVVNISTEQIRKEGYPFSMDSGDPYLDQFFQDFFRSFAPREYKTQSLGSGVIISPEGYILTNEHVVSHATRIKVRLINQKEYPAALVGSDPKSDLAVLRLQTDAPLPFIRMGRSDDLMIGETVIAIGNPFALSHTVTTGVISALNRSIRTEGRVYEDFIQTDASINPGNSGGPLLNINAELIGINTAIYQKAEGIGFAIPINRARRIYEDLIAYGEVHKPWMGIFLQDLTPQLAQYFGLDQTQGALISRVIKGSPGDHAGLKQGDIIARIGKETVKDRESCLSLTEAYKAGEVIPLTIIRKGNPQEVQVKSTEISPESALKISMEWTGLEVEEITSKGQGQDTGRGVIIIRVNKHSDAFRIGIREGDIIRQVNNTRISGMKDYKNAMKQALYAENVVLLVFRNNTGYYVTLTP